MHLKKPKSLILVKKKVGKWIKPASRWVKKDPKREVAVGVVMYNLPDPLPGPTPGVTDPVAIPLMIDGVRRIKNKRDKKNKKSKHSKKKKSILHTLKLR